MSNDEKEREVKAQMLGRCVIPDGAYPGDSSLRTLMAEVLGKKAEDAYKQGDWNGYDQFVGELLGLQRATLDDPDILRSAVLCLAPAILNTNAREEGRERRSRLLDNLRDLRGANPDMEMARSLFAWSLHNIVCDSIDDKDFTLLEQSINEMRQVSIEFPEDGEVREILDKCLRHAVSGDKLAENRVLRQQLLDELDELKQS